MKKAWDVIMTDMGKVRFIQPEEFSPYIEFDEETTDELTQIYELQYNGMYRFEGVLSELFEARSINEETKKWLNDIFIHYLFKIEFRSGLSRREFQVRSIEQEMLSGIYGQQEAEFYKGLDRKERHLIAEGIYRQKKIGASVELFGEMCIQALHKSVLYRNDVDRKVLMLCVSDRNLYRESGFSMITLLANIFMPLDYSLQVFYGDTFGILGEALTMQPEHFVLF